MRTKLELQNAEADAAQWRSLFEAAEYRLIEKSVASETLESRSAESTVLHGKLANAWAAHAVMQERHDRQTALLEGAAGELAAVQMANSDGGVTTQARQLPSHQAPVAELEAGLMLLLRERQEALQERKTMDVMLRKTEAELAVERRLRTGHMMISE